MPFKSDTLEPKSSSANSTDNPSQRSMLPSPIVPFAFLPRSSEHENLAVQELRRQDQSQRVDFSKQTFVEHAGQIVPMHPGQQLALMSERRFIGVYKGWQAGGAFPLDTPIPTPGGFVPIGCLEVGDEVFDRYGKVCRVSATPDPFVPDVCYRLTFCDGTSVVTDGGHRWFAESWRQRRNRQRDEGKGKIPKGSHCAYGSVVTTSEMYERQVGLDGGAEWSIPMPDPAEYPERDLPLDPYLFGAWLGDGHTRINQITSADPEIIEQFEAAGFRCRPAKSQNSGNATTYVIGTRTGKPFSRSTDFGAALALTGARGDKHVPDAYMQSSVRQRLALLQGLMDTDGSCNDRGHVEFSGISQRLCRNVLELFRSLGIKARMAPHRSKKDGRDCGPLWRVRAYPHLSVFRLSRKAARQRMATRPDVYARYVRKIEKVAPEPVRCIQVDSADHLYLATRDYLVTHNTVIGAPWLRREMQMCGPGDYAVICPTKPLMKNKVRPELERAFRGIVKMSGDEWVVTPDGAAILWGDRTLTGRILLRTAWKAEMIESFTAKAIWADEPGQMEDSIWEAMQARVAVCEGRILLTSRPYTRNWFVKEIWDKVVDKRYLPKGAEDIDTYRVRRRRDAPADMEVVCFSSKDNPAFSDAEFDRQLGLMPWWRFAMRYLGVPTKAAAMIYDCFDEDVNTCARFPIPAHWKRVQGVDFGTVNIASIWLAEDPDTPTDKPTWFLFSQYGQPKLTAREHVANWTKRLGKKAGKLFQHLVRGGAKDGEESWRELFREVGCNILPPTLRHVEPGIDLVYAMMRDGRLIVFDDMDRVLKDIYEYCWEVDDDGMPNPPKIADKEKFHFADALRYGCQATGSEGLVVLSEGTRDAKERRETERVERNVLGVHDGDFDEPSLVGRGAAGGSRGLMARPERSRSGDLRVVRLGSSGGGKRSNPRRG